ncbi:MAG: PAS domain S-box protein [Deltaproteobacteria bacterium]|nr:PAS domain S-box protein [Deltaproteobacteria bacterium]
MQKMTDEQNGLLEISILKGAVENTNEAFVTIDQDSTVIFFNKAAERMFGYCRRDVVGQNLAKILGPVCREGHQRAVDQYVRTKKAKLIGHETEFQAMRKGGATFPASISFSVTVVDGACYFTGIVRELTETKALHAQIVQAERLAALGQMVAEISHEIKNPLVMIGGFARQLLKKISGEKEQAKLEVIVGEVERLENLLAELKDLYRPRRLNLADFDMDELLREVCTLTRENMKNDALIIQCQAGPGHKMITGDRDKLKQVMLNVVKNGAEALPEGHGAVSVLSELRGETILVTVTDDGGGIPEKLLRKIFSPFFTTKEHGTGLGLSISKRIVDEHPGGVFSLRSEEGQGTTVTITLPRHSGLCPPQQG